MRQFKAWLETNIITAYRGTGPAGLKQMRPSEEGVYGPGIYFYDDFKDAAAFAEPGGGVIAVEVDIDDPNVQVFERPVHLVGSDIELRKSKIIVVPDSSYVNVTGPTPTEDT